MQELLHSELVPLAEDEQYLREALHAFTSTNSAFRPRVIDVLFSQVRCKCADLRCICTNALCVSFASVV